MAIIRRGGATVVPCDVDRPSGRPAAGEVISRYLWWVTVATVAGLGAGLYAGVGGRLVMRLLAETSPDAQGRLTEADEVVGGLLVVTFGMLVAALAGGFSRSLRPLAVPLRSISRASSPAAGRCCCSW